MDSYVVVYFLNQPALEGELHKGKNFVDFLFILGHT